MLVDERRVLMIAQKNLERWLASPAFALHGRRALLEWKDILESCSGAEIRAIITADTDEGQRLRSSSPFAGVLTLKERRKSWSECAEIGLA